MSETVTLEDIRTIIQLVRDSENVAEFSLKYGDLEISLSRSGPKDPAAAAAPPGPPSEALRRTEPGGTPDPQAPASTPQPTRSSAVQSAASGTEPQQGEIVVKAPMVGTFYRSPKPGEPPFVNVGATVGKDSVLCIIEVMKLMNSIQAGVEGTVTRILVEDAQPVDYGQPLIFIRVSGQ